MALNECPYDANLAEMKQFQKFAKEFLIPKKWKPYRTEWAVYDELVFVAGQIDNIFVDTSTGDYHMLDWKRCEKKIQTQVPS